MMREGERWSDEEPRGASGVARGQDRDAAERKSENEADQWNDTGTDDPAFYLKPSDEE